MLSLLALALPLAALPQKVLIVGGGPNLSHNQVAIESNVRYVLRMLPKDITPRVLFADGDAASKTVLFEDEKHQSQYRSSEIPHIDGPSRYDTVKTELLNLAGDLKPKQPVFLYFTGHGSPNAQSQFANNQFDLWKGEAYTVKDLATSLQSYPRDTPVTLLMVECFSGAFGNVLFENGDPQGELTNRPVCGFFASIAQRPAAGCTPELNEANYKDFTSYFVAVLTGTSRIGQATTGADYNNDGKVGMNEAFAYALINDDSIDTPVCTSDVFVRRFVTTPDEEVFTTSYPEALSWASPSQKAALEALSMRLGFTGDDRLKQAYTAFRGINLGGESDRETHLIRYVRLAKSVILAHTLRTTVDRQLRKRFDELLKLESGNPFSG